MPDALPHLKFPEWLPWPAAQAAKNIRDGSGAIEDLGLLIRLATDQRMKTVWSLLNNQNVFTSQSFAAHIIST
jgi:hypothetical protein